MTRKKAGKGSYKSMLSMIDGWRCLIRRKAETKCRRKIHVPIECNWNQQDCLVRMSSSGAERRILNLTIGLVEVRKEAGSNNGGHKRLDLIIKCHKSLAMTLIPY